VESRRDPSLQVDRIRNTPQIKALDEHSRPSQKRQLRRNLNGSGGVIANGGLPAIPLRRKAS
jgi:hypothetical protein